MQMPGTAISPDTSSVLYPMLGTQGAIIIGLSFVAFFAVWRFRLFSSSGSVILGREVSFSPLRRALFSSDTRTDTITTEPRSIRAIRVWFGALWLFDALLQAKPNMPGDMVQLIIKPALANQPGPIAWLMRGGIYFWSFNPISADAATIWIQAAIGGLLILGVRRPIRTIAAYSSIVWGLVIWVFGEGLGMLFTPGNSWFLGSPGAAIFYVIAGALLLLSDTTTSSIRFYDLAKKGIGGFWIAMAILQAIPFEGFWSGANLSNVFRTMSSMAMPTFVTGPMAFLARATASNPMIWNLIFISVMLFIGLGIFFSESPKGFVYASIVFSALTWWLGMGFGFLASSGTDPNSALPVVMLSGALLLVGSAQPTRRPLFPNYPGEPKALGISLAIIAIGVAIIPMLASLPAAASASSIYSAVSDGGGLTQLNRAAPDFSLIDQNGRKVSLATFRNKAVVLTFLDPVCYDVCPVMSSEITNGVARLGKSAKDVAMVAIDINPSFTTLAAIRQFDNEHGLSKIANWYYLTGPLSQLYRVWQNYAVTPTTGPVGMLSHPQVIYFLSKSAREIALTGDSGSSSSGLKFSYTNLVASTTKAALTAR